jgi:hypothetical protein
MYTIWKNIRQRCNNPRHKQYTDYGGRGIKICDEWSDFLNFYSWSMANGYKDDLSIDRIDNDKGYSPDNCRWTDKFGQARNKRNLVMIRYQGKKKCIAEWAEVFGLPYEVLRLRIKDGWDLEKAFTTPSGNQNLFTYQGKTMAIAAWERELGMKEHTLWARLKRGWSFERAVTTPVRKIKHSQ